MATALTHIRRYPVKGLSAEELAAVEVRPGETLPNDRRFAIAHGASRFDPNAPEWHPKRQFLVLMTHERLAQLSTRFDDDTGILTIERDGRPVARGQITTPLGKDLITQFLAAFMDKDTQGTPKLVEAPGVSFTDQERNVLSLINLASLRDLERVTRRPVDPVRFRGNLYVEGARPWEEFDWVGQRLRIGEAVLRVVERIDRCAAVNVNPQTADRDMNVVKALQAGYGHVDCGVFLEVETAGTVKPGDPVAVLA